MKDVKRKLVSLLGSRTFFYIVVGFLVFQALWFVFSAIYPMAFDEDFHLGVIRIYAEHFSPFLSGQPDGADKLGAVARDPSYLYHYLMSFPYRLIALFTDSETIQVIVLRLINVALFAWSLVLFCKVLQKASISPALTNVSMAIMVLIPIVPQLAAHINYDNLLMVLVAWLCLLTFRVVDSLREQRVDMTAHLAFLVVGLFTSIVKYAALPLVVAAVLFIIITAFVSFRGKGKRLLYRVKDGYVRMGRATKIVLIAALALGSVLFVQRYIVNIVHYGDPVPDCGKILSIEQCSQYGPWGRDYFLEHTKSRDFKPNFLYFTDKWIEGMRHRLFFAVNGAKAHYSNFIQLPVPVGAATVIIVVGLLAVCRWWRQIFRSNPDLVFFGLLIGIYVAVLFVDQYGMYIQTGLPVAINGRYLLPVLPPMAALLGTGIAFALRRYRVERVKPYLAVLAILLFLHGGGVMTFILRSDPSWYWPNQFVEDVNHRARTVLAPFIIEGNKYQNGQP